MRKGLLAIAVIGAVAAAFWYWSGPAANTVQTVAAATTGTQTTPVPPAAPVPKVELEKLKAPRPEPEETRRNPFRFEGPRQGPTPGQPSPSPVPAPGPVMQPLPVQPPAPVGPPLIPLKFIGTVEAPRRGTKLAVLSDGRDVFYGREGDVIDGRY